MDNGRYSWSADFDDRGFNQDGCVRTFGEAQQCVAGAVENATVEAELSPAAICRRCGEPLENPNERAGCRDPACALAERIAA
jgi:hypothetical protein